MDETLLDLVVQALTTPGYANENPELKDYERLEFLGDAILKAHLSKAIFNKYPDLDEGRMSKLCQNLWNDKTYPFCLAEQGMDFHYLIFMPKSEENQSKEHRVDFIASVVSDCFEAIVGALSLSTLSEAG